MPDVGEPQLQTERLWLRPWTDADREPFAAMNVDPLVMEHFPGLMARADSDRFVDRIMAHFDERGYGLWAVEANPDEPVPGFIGFVGLMVPRFTASFTPCVEVGWRLRHDAWGRGYATEAANAALTFAFEVLQLEEIVSFTTTNNLRSRAVMERLGLVHDPTQDFDHPLLPDWPNRRHVLYRLSRAGWLARG